MKRSLISLAAQVVAGRVPQQSVTLFGVADYSQPELPVLSLQPSDAFWIGVDYGREPDVGTYVMPSRQFGKTATLEEMLAVVEADPPSELPKAMKLHPWQEEILRKFREQKTGVMPWP